MKTNQLYILSQIFLWSFFVVLVYYNYYKVEKYNFLPALLVLLYLITRNLYQRAIIKEKNQKIFELEQKLKQFS